MTPIERIEAIAQSAKHDAHPAGQVSALARAVLDYIAELTPAQPAPQEPAQPAP